MNTPEADKTIMAEKAARERLQMQQSAVERVRLTANQPPAPHSVPTDELDIVAAIVQLFEMAHCVRAA